MTSKEDQERRRREKLDEAKKRIGITIAWQALGLTGKPGRVCRSPFRKDDHPSLSISNDEVWFDHATGEGGDVVTFIETALQCPAAEAIEYLKRLAGNDTVKTAPRSPTARPPQAQKKITLPAFSTPTINDLAELQLVRGWPLFAGMEIASRRGVLHTCTMPDNGTPTRAWALTDSARKSVQVRRIDGKPWAWNDAKAWTLGGSLAGWPIGCAEIAPYPVVLFCEGGPDLLAALTLAFLHGFHPAMAGVCMPGANAKIVDDALTLFAGKRVRIFEHADEAGVSAGPRWAKQLTQAGAVVDGVQLPTGFNDVADVLAATDPENLLPPTNIFAGLNMEDFKCPTE